jgi:hypothetical protein
MRSLTVRSPTLARSAGCPFLAELTSTPRQATAKDGTMRCAQPEALILVQDGKLCHQIMLTLLTFQHRHPHHVQVPPSSFHTAAIMA